MRAERIPKDVDADGGDPGFAVSTCPILPSPTAGSGAKSYLEHASATYKQPIPSRAGTSLQAGLVVRPEGRPSGRSALGDATLLSGIIG